MAVALRPAAPAVHPRRRGKGPPHHPPLAIRHVRAVPLPAVRVIGRVPEPVGEAVTRAGGRAGLRGCDHVQLRHRASCCSGFDNRELPGGPLFMRAQPPTHPIQVPVRQKAAPRSEGQRLLRRPSWSPFAMASSTSSKSWSLPCARRRWVTLLPQSFLPATSTTSTAARSALAEPAHHCPLLHTTRIRSEHPAGGKANLHLAPRLR